jgi:hypothetical protein
MGNAQKCAFSCFSEQINTCKVCTLCYLFKVGINPVSRQNFQLLYLLNKNSECGKVYIFGKDVSQRIHLQNQISQKIIIF